MVLKADEMDRVGELVDQDALRRIGIALAAEHVFLRATHRRPLVAGAEPARAAVPVRLRRQIGVLRQVAGPLGGRHHGEPDVGLGQRFENVIPPVEHAADDDRRLDHGRVVDLFRCDDREARDRNLLLIERRQLELPPQGIRRSVKPDPPLAGKTPSKPPPGTSFAWADAGIGSGEITSRAGIRTRRTFVRVGWTNGRFPGEKQSPQDATEIPIVRRCAIPTVKRWRVS